MANFGPDKPFKGAKATKATGGALTLFVNGLKLFKYLDNSSLSFSSC